MALDREKRRMVQRQTKCVQKQRLEQISFEALHSALAAKANFAQASCA